MNFVNVLAPLLLPASFTAQTALGQECPLSSKKEFSIPSQVQTLEGQLIYHDRLRQTADTRRVLWQELALERAKKVIKKP